MVFNTIKDGTYRDATKFLWFPKIDGDKIYWLETVTVKQRYHSRGAITSGWYDVCLVNPKTGLPISIDPVGSVTQEHESIEETRIRFLKKGVHENKMIFTLNPSVVIWSKSRKCIVEREIDPIELITDENGDMRLPIENNAIISLQNRGELTEEDVKEINNSEGIIVTNATYGKPYFRYGFIPKS